MNKLFCTLVLVLIGFCLQAQTFKAEYAPLAVKINEPKFAKTFGTGYQFSATSLKSGTVPGIRFVNTDAQGVVTDTGAVNFTIADGLQTIATVDNKFAVLGKTTSNSKLFLRKLNANGSTIWNKSFALPTNSAFSNSEPVVVQAADGRYFISVFVNFADSVGSRLAVYKLTASGGLTWLKTYSNPNFEAPFINIDKIIPSIGGGCLVNWAILNSQFGVSNFNTSGTLLAHKILAQSTNFVAQIISTSGNQFVVLTGFEGGFPPNITKYKSNGTSLWFKSFNEINSFTSSSSGRVLGTLLSNGDIVVCGRADDYNVAQLYLGKFKGSNGSLLSKNTNFGFNLTPTTISVLPDGGFLGTGYTATFNPVLFRTDAAGNIISTTAPDIAVSDIQFPSSGTIGEVVFFTFDLENRSTIAVSGNYNIKTYISNDPFFSPASDSVVGTVATGFTGPGLTNNVVGAITVPNITSSNNSFLFISCDADNQISESVETNNTTWTDLFQILPTSANLVQFVPVVTNQVAYPNPVLAGSEFHLLSSLFGEADIEFCLYDTQGKVIKKGTATPKAETVTIATNPEMAQGIYFVVLERRGKVLLVSRIEVK